MTITQLRYVLAVAESKNFSLAAKNIFVTQPTLSMQIQKLEEELDILIFDRNKKPIQLTKVGYKIVQQAKKIIDETGRIHDMVEQEKGYIGGTFTLGIIGSIIPNLLPIFLKLFIQKYPKVHLIIKEQNTEEIIRNLQDGHLDAAIASTPLSIEFILEKPLYYEPFVGYIPKFHPLSKCKKIAPEDLDIRDILLLEEGHCFSNSICNLCKINKKPKHKQFQLYSGNFDTLINLANKGLGITILPYLSTLHMHPKDSENIRLFVEPSPVRQVSLLYHKKELKIQILKALEEVITKVIRSAIVLKNIKVISPISEKNL